MAKAKPKRKAKKGGRPTKWRPEFTEQAKILMLEGFSLAKLAKFFKINPKTLHEWMKEKEEFRNTINDARDLYDSGQVEISTLKAARGFYFTETTSENKFVIEKDEEGKEIGDEYKERMTKKIKKYVTPNPTMNIFWLKNRHPERWQDVQKQDHSGAVTVVLAGEYEGNPNPK